MAEKPQKRQTLKERGVTNVTYRRRNPKPGERIVHNFPPGDPKRPFGEMGFRYWSTTEAAENQALCECGWEPNPHYTTKRKGSDAQ